MLKSVIFSIVAVIMMATTLFGQFDSTTIGGYVKMESPNSETKSFTLENAVLKFNGFKDGIIGQVQYDFASTYLIAAQTKVPFTFASGQGMLYVGRTFTGAGQVTPGPDGLIGQSWYPIHNSYSFIEDGVGLSWERGPFTAYAVKGTSMSFSATVKGVQVIWQENFAKTLAYQTSTIKFLPGMAMDIFGGFTWYNGTRSDQWTIVYNFYISDLQLYVEADGGDIVQMIGGGRYNFSSHAGIKYAYNDSTEKHYVAGVFTF